MVARGALARLGDRVEGRRQLLADFGLHLAPGLPEFLVMGGRVRRLRLLRRLLLLNVLQSRDVTRRYLVLALEVELEGLRLPLELRLVVAA